MFSKKEYCIKVYSKNKQHEMYIRFLATGEITLVKSNNMSLFHDPKILVKLYMEADKPDKEFDEYDFKEPVIVEIKTVREEMGETDLSYYLEH